MYLVHVPLVMAAQLVVRQWSLPAELKFVVILATVTLLLLASYRWCVDTLRSAACSTGRGGRDEPVAESGREVGQIVSRERGRHDVGQFVIMEPGLHERSPRLERVRERQCRDPVLRVGKHRGVKRDGAGRRAAMEMERQVGAVGFTGPRDHGEYVVHLLSQERPVEEHAQERLLPVVAEDRRELLVELYLRSRLSHAPHRDREHPLAAGKGCCSGFALRRFLEIAVGEG